MVLGKYVDGIMGIVIIPVGFTHLSLLLFFFVAFDFVYTFCSWSSILLF